jgi:hypothetical protein
VTPALLAASVDMDVAMTSVPWEQLPAQPPPVEFASTGSGSMFVTVSAEFMDTATVSHPRYAGLLVTKSIHRREVCPSSWVHVAVWG